MRRSWRPSSVGLVSRAWLVGMGVCSVFSVGVWAAAVAAGGSWDAPTEVSGSPGGSGYLYGVSCSSAGDCTGVGWDGNFQPLYVSESGGSWGAPTELAIPSGQPGPFPEEGSLDGVSCVDADDCTAVGWDAPDDNSLYATESGGS
jgi:hypothetical protein